jgi:t-SNARE complex subunit (syntaxin)
MNRSMNQPPVKTFGALVKQLQEIERNDIDLDNRAEVLDENAKEFNKETEGIDEIDDKSTCERKKWTIIIWVVCILLLIIAIITAIVVPIVCCGNGRNFTENTHDLNK